MLSENPNKILKCKGMKMPNPIIKMGTRILRPSEFNLLIGAVPKQDHRVQLKALLLSGMRFEECKSLYNHPGWFDGQFIRIPSTKKKAVQDSRWIRLNPLGGAMVEHFLNLKKGPPHRVTFWENLRRWSSDAGLDTEGITNKSTRKTWESWLMFYYPERVTEITLSQGHTGITQIKHYVNLPFTEEDKTQMEPYVQGWI
jgi:integrase